MRHAILAVVLVLTASAAQAQTAADQRNIVHLFFGPGSAPDTSLVSFGGGGELTLSKGFAAAGELAVVTATSGHHNGLALSIDGVYHLPVGRERATGLKPFASGGFSLLFGGGSEAAWNIGGGVDYFLGARVAVRVDLRDYLSSEYSPPPPALPYSNYIARSHIAHVWTVRGGLVFHP